MRDGSRKECVKNREARKNTDGLLKSCKGNNEEGEETGTFLPLPTSRGLR